MRSTISALRTAALAAALIGSLTAPLAAAQPAGRGMPGDAGPIPKSAAAKPAAATSKPGGPVTDAAAIVAVVNGDIISKGDVENRRRLFALSTGLPMSPEVLERLTPQVTKQLVDEKLRLQESQRRKIVVTDQEIFDAIAQVEKQNNMPPGALKHRLEADQVGLRTLVDQVRVQIGWTRVLREELGKSVEITDADIADQERIFKEQTGQQEYRLAEIFVPVSDPRRAADAQRFADTVIQQLRAGAPFPVVAAQFSQSQTALQGGDLGWREASELDPEVLRVAKEMPPGAVSNPIHVPGGISIVTLRAARTIGNDPATMLKLRQVFFPFTAKLDPANPTEQQKKALADAKRLSDSAKTCEAMDEANKGIVGGRPADPGEVRLETVGSPGLKNVLAGLPPLKTSQPLVAEDGIAVIMVCSRETKNMGVPTRQELTEKVLEERVELASRQLQRDLERRAVIDQRS